MKFSHSITLLSLVAAASAFLVEEVAVPSAEADKHSNLGTTGITVGGVTYDTEYHVLLRSGDKVKNVTFGAVVDENGTQIFSYPMDASYVEMPLDDDGSPNDVNKSEPLISQIADFTSLIATPKAEYKTPTDFAMFAHFETPLPATIYRINVDFDDDCMLVEDSLEATNWSAWGGLWEPCSGKVTPWNTHLGSEEHEPDARLMSANYSTFVKEYNNGNTHAKNIMHFMRYYGLYSKDVKNDAGMNKLREVFNPYKFGHVTEVSVNADGSTKTQKWYSTGRVSIENPEIMPDEKTIYIADDANYGILTRFVMDKAQDMSSGTLYAAQFTQVSDQYVAVEKKQAGGAAATTTEAGGTFTTQWIELGKAKHDDIYKMVWEDGITFDDIFLTAEPDEDDACPDGFDFIINGWDKPIGECLKLKSADMATAAAFLETRRYANMLGATAEMQSTEGMASVPKDNKFYFAMSNIKNGMSDGEGHISVPENKCGCIYEFDVDPATYELGNGRALVCGEPDDKDPANPCSVDSIASPDNLAYTGLFGTEDDHSLLIAEDTSYHQNDYMWHYDLTTGDMTRMLTSVYGSQVTGPAYFTDNMGCYLLMAVIPHPYKKSDQDKWNHTLSEGLWGNVGYIGPIGTRDEL